MGCKGSKSAAAGVPAVAEKPVEGDFKVSLERGSDDEVLGLSVVEVTAGILGVEAVKEEGLVPAFMKKDETASDQHIKVGDKLIAVNGVTGDTEQMKKELGQKVVVLTVQRAKTATQEAGEGDKAPDDGAAETKAEEAAAKATEVGGADAAEAKGDDVVAPALELPLSAVEEGTTTVTGDEVKETVMENAEEERLCKMSMC
eukprot:TRINITY_DN13988_c0_g1_i1.p1 TRINITY_DN13988_c0_g1~~TRINITY_DN13988_c0_g1_i1.p1  ORF type:complete len:225 (+),score=79.79 TRINITY_DN13988_c0_g1_i1:73-675(+)